MYTYIYIYIYIYNPALKTWRSRLGPRKRRPGLSQRRGHP